MKTKDEALKLALEVLKGCFDHPDAQDAIDAIEAELAQPEQEPFGYFRDVTFGWTDCAEADEGAIALYERPAPVQTAEQPELEACAELAGEFARKWWSIHCASNKHMETTRKAHDDFCALQAMIRATGETSPPARPTGWDNGLCQDYNKKLGAWFSEKPNAKQELRVRTFDDYGNKIV